MKLLLPLLLLLIGTPLTAQLSLRVEPANVVKEVVVDDLDEDYQDITSVTVTNTSGRNIQLVQRMRIQDAPTRWEYGIFSRSNHTAPYPMSRRDLDEGRPVRLSAGESATFVVVLAPGGISGAGTIEVEFSDFSVPGKVITNAAFSTKIIRRPRVNATNPPSLNTGGTSSPDRPVPTTVRIYPNPDQGKNFFVEAPPGTTIGRVEIANTLGNRLRSFSADPGEVGYDIKDLPDGLYLVFIYDRNGKKLKTLRLLHRRFGA